MLPVVSFRVIAEPAPAVAGPVSAETTTSDEATAVPDSGTFFAFSSVSFEAKLRVATLEPRDVGVRRTVTCRVAAGARLNAPPPATIEYSAVPTSVVEVTFRVAVPMLRTVTARSLNEPWLTLPKASDAGAVSMSGKATPVPDSGTFFGFSSVSFEAKLKVATLEPREVGVRRTVTCQVAAGARLNAPPPATIEYSAVPRSVVEVTFRVAVPMLRTVTARSLNEPWLTLPKPSDAGAVSMSGVARTAPPRYRASAKSARPLIMAPPAK